MAMEQRISLALFVLHPFHVMYSVVSPKLPF